MKVSVNKKALKIFIGIIIAILIIVVGIFASQYISTSIKIAKTEKKLSEIDSTELQSKLIEELKNSKLYLNLDTGNIYVGTMFDEGIAFKDYITVSYLGIKNGNPVGAVEIPCFKINSDNNGKFKSIEYTERTVDKTIVPGIVEKVFKDNYDVDLKIVGNTRYNKKFNKDIRGYTHKGKIYVDDDNFYIAILESVNDNLNIGYGEKVEDGFKEYGTQTFGLDK